MDKLQEVLSKLEGLELRLKRLEENLNEQVSLSRQSLILQKIVLNLKEVAEYVDMSESHIYKLTAQKKIPHFNPGGKRLYFKREEIDQWLMRNRQSSEDEIQVKAANYLLGNKK